MATTLRFVLLGDDLASKAFDSFRRSVEHTSVAVDKQNAAQKRLTKTNKDAINPLADLVLHVTGFGDAVSAASRKTPMWQKALLGVMLATGPAEAAVSALIVNVGALASALTVAGAGIAAYGVAVMPVMKELGTATKAQSTLQAAQAKANAQYNAALKAGVPVKTADAAKTKAMAAAQAAYNAQMKGMPPAVKATAKALESANKEWKNWANSLSGMTLTPLLTMLNQVKPVLHALTPLVKAAAGAFITLTNELGAKIQGGGVERFVTTILPYVRPVLIDLGHSIANVIGGIWGIVQAFLPFSTTVTGGLESITKKFDIWANHLKTSSGFKALLGQWRDNWPEVKKALGQMFGIVRNIVSTWAWMTTPSNSKAMWEIANPLLAVASALSGNRRVVEALTYLYLISVGASKLKGVFSLMKTAWDSVGKVVALFTGKKVGMQAAGDTMLLASQNMQKAADTMVGASGGAGAAEGAAGGAAARRVGTAGLGGSILGAFANIGIPVWLASMLHLPGSKGQSVLQVDMGLFQKQIGHPIAVAFGTLFSPSGAVAKSAQVSQDWFNRVIGDPFLHFLGSAFTPGGAINKSASAAGHDLVFGLWHGIVGAWHSFWNWVTRLPGAIITMFEHVLGIASPSKVFMRIGRDVIAGLWNGMVNAWHSFWNWVTSLPGRIIRVFAGAGKWLYQHGVQLIAGLWNGLRNRWTGFAAWMSGMPGRIGGFFHGALNWLFAAGRNVIWGLYNGLRSVWSKVTSFISSIGGWIKAHKGPIPLDRALLVPAGQAIMRGLHTGLIMGSGGPLGFISGLAGTIGSLIDGGVSGLLKKMTAGGGGDWTGVILTALKLLGQPASWLGVVQHRLMQESGGNALAVNRWDSNWAAGTPSVGGMQVIGPTFAAYAGPFRNVGPFMYGVSVNRLANMYAGLNYALHRYGTLAALMQPGGYAQGGPITEPIFGVGRSGRAYTFGEGGAHEYVSSQADLHTVAKLLAAVLAELRAISGHVQVGPARTGRAVSLALNGAAAGASLAR